MSVAETWEAKVDGRKQQVLVAYFDSRPGHPCMVYTTLVDKAAFAAFLATIRVTAH